MFYRAFKKNCWQAVRGFSWYTLTFPPDTKPHFDHHFDPNYIITLIIP
jgi:hypothetical protein